MKNKLNGFPIILIAMLFLLFALSNTGVFSSIAEQFKDSRNSIRNLTNTINNAVKENNQTSKNEVYDLSAYDGQQVVVLNGNIPYFTLAEIEKYTTLFNKTKYKLSDLDLLKRAGSAIMLVGPETLNFEEREDISGIYPSGYKQAKYDDLIEDGWLYNRCHLLAHCLSGLNAEERNLITCTRQTNADAMLNFEVNIVSYINETKNHVLYRVTPIYEGVNLVAKGILLEGISIEDDGLQMCVFIYNIQDGIDIDYRTGESSRSE